MSANSRFSSSSSRGDARFEIVHHIDVRHDRMVRHALQRLVAEMAGLAAADHGRIDVELREAAQARHGGDDGRHVGDLVLGEMARLGARIGDQLLALAVIELLRDRQASCRRSSPSAGRRSSASDGRSKRRGGACRRCLDRDGERARDSRRRPRRSPRPRRAS